MPALKGHTPWNKGKGKGWTDQRGYRWIYVFENGKRRAKRERETTVSALYNATILRPPYNDLLECWPVCP